jgi:hypothetical protein
VQFAVALLLLKVARLTLLAVNAIAKLIKRMAAITLVEGNRNS